MSLSGRSGFPASLTVALVALFAIGPVSAAPREHPSLLLHIGPPNSKIACSGPVRCQDVVTTMATCDGPAFVYLLAGNGFPDSSGTLAGLQCGIEYSGWGPASRIQVHEWHLCATLQFPYGGWPESGSSNLITWDPDNNCQTGELAVAGYFYVTPYSAATMRLIPRPVDGQSKVANCDAREFNVYPGRLGSVSFAAGPGFNPCLEPPSSTVPYLSFREPKDGEILDDDDVRVGLWAVDDETPLIDLAFSWRIDGASWSEFEAGFQFPGTHLMNLPSGSHLFEIQCRDASGEVGTAEVRFLTNVEPNDPPRTILLSGPAEGDTIYGGPVTFNWTGEDDRTPPDSLYFLFGLEGQGIEAVGPGRDHRRNSVTYDTLAPGPHRFRVHAVDGDDEEEHPSLVRNFVYQFVLNSSIRDIAPNPTSGPMTVEIDVASEARIRIHVFDIAGRRVRTLFDGDCPAGYRTVPWDGRNEAGSRLASGTYFLRMETPEGPMARRFLMVR